MSAIFWLSARQLTDRRRFLFVLLLAVAPTLLAGLFITIDALSTDNARDPISEELDFMVGFLTLVATLPTMVLLLTTVNFGDELEDRTLIYLVAKPISRWRIVLPKFAASLTIALTLALIGNVAMVSLSVFTSPYYVDSDLSLIATTSAGVVVAVLFYGTLFTWAGLVYKHALPIGLVYLVIWEIVLSSAFAGARFLSARHFAYAVIHRLEESLLVEAAIDVSAGAAIVGTVVVAVASAVLTERRLRRMEVP